METVVQWREDRELQSRPAGRCSAGLQHSSCLAKNARNEVPSQLHSFSGSYIHCTAVAQWMGQLIRDVTTVSHSNSTTIKYHYRHLSDGLGPQAFLTSLTDWAAQMYQMYLHEVRALHSPTWSPARYCDICPLLYSLIMNSNVFPSLDTCFWPLRGRTGV